MVLSNRRETVGVRVGSVTIGGGAPISVQSMTNTTTADAQATARQILELANAGSELVRFTVNTSEAAATVPEIRKRLLDAGCSVPLIGDFHYNGHRLLKEYPDCAQVLDKYRINPGNVGRGEKRDDNFATICAIARDNGKVVRIGVNSGSLDPQLVESQMRENTEKGLGKDSEEIFGECMIISALESTAAAVRYGLSEDQIVISCKMSDPLHLIDVHRKIARQTRQPLHLGLTEAGMGIKGAVWSATAMGILLSEGIGDTIRVSLTPRAGGARTEEVHAACEILQSLGLRSFFPTVTACPGCGRTTSTTFQQLAEEVENYIHDRLPQWKQQYKGFEQIRIAVMGCVVNGPGESRAANIGISLPGAGEEPRCPVYVDGKLRCKLEGDATNLAKRFKQLLEEYIESHCARR